MPADTARWIVSLADKYDAESDSLRFGSIKAPGVTHKEDKLLFPMPDYATYDNSDLLCRVKVETDSDFDPEDARVAGNFMHSVMSKVTSASDLEFACRYQARQVGLPEEIAKKRYRFLADAISKPEVARWFIGFRRVLTERSIDAGNFSQRPDRVVWTADGHIDVVDYKFGDIHSSSYSDQVRRYVDALRLMGYESVRGFLWYPLENLVVTVDDGSEKTLF